jgi:hypothetical protein
VSQIKLRLIAKKCYCWFICGKPRHKATQKAHGRNFTRAPEISWNQQVRLKPSPGIERWEKKEADAMAFVGGGWTCRIRESNV